MCRPPCTACLAGAHDCCAKVANCVRSNQAQCFWYAVGSWLQSDCLGCVSLMKKQLIVGVRLSVCTRDLP